MTTKTDAKEVDVLKKIVSTLVTDQNAVTVEIKEEAEGTLLFVKVDAKDMGILIGRNGIMATSIKMIIKAIGKAEGRNVRVQFLEPDGSLKYGDQKSDASKIYRGPRPTVAVKPPATARKKMSEKEAETMVDQLDNELDEFVIN